MPSKDTRLSRDFPLRKFGRLGKYSDASESIYVVRQDLTVNGKWETVYYIARDMSFTSKAVMAGLDEPWIETTTEKLLDAVGDNVEEMQHHDTVTTWWELAADSDSAAYTLFMLVVAELLRK